MILYVFYLLLNSLKFPTLTDEGLTPTKDGGTCLRRISMERKFTNPSSLSFVFVIFDSQS